MLFNTAWQKKSVEILLSTANLMAWLEKQPADEGYDYQNPYACLLAKYLYANGERNCRVSSRYLFGGPFGDGFNCTRIPSAFYTAVTPRPRTYGAALNRLKACV